ncbi:MAG TPA: shikimate dehydrogenase [Paludibacteraceae bacterium]|nr:shikimate dehydrogenase [Paludibacteraceae bacterium]HOL00673.1 shikimate dehydrogenase [Paludibacteraceae bacterium]HPO67571.1 shikimate dehydrogenase [Paludibacteraceae bacterium]HRR62392.1 shikimate dehydrogenase [Paludibacteraceae bacterium]
MKLYGLIGYPLTHSFSKKYFTEKFEKENIDARYNLYELENIDLFPELKNIPELAGLNVTIPYKEQIIPYLDELDDTAKEIGAVNVIKFIRNGKILKLKGYNTDVIGFEKSILPFLQPYHRKALILGTGGVSKAIYFVLQKLGIETTFVSRRPCKGMLSYEMLDNQTIRENKLIINATPLGTFPHADECPAIPYPFLTNEHLLFDVVYNPPETLFLRKGKLQGAKGVNGEKMLEEQAEAAWKIWNEPEK